MNESPVSPPMFHYGQNVMFNGHEYAIRQMCHALRHGEWYHEIIRGLPVGRCTDGRGLEILVVADSELKAVVR